jgi:hypothetical protein
VLVRLVLRSKWCLLKVLEDAAVQVAGAQNVLAEVDLEVAAVLEAGAQSVLVEVVQGVAAVLVAGAQVAGARRGGTGNR